MHLRILLLTAVAGGFVRLRAADETAPEATTFGPLSVRSFRQHVEKAGTEEEDWQPAFQKAIEQARQEIRPIHVPAGVYRIRQAIRITPADTPANPFGFRNLRIVGEGRHQTIIQQDVDTENVFDWTGLTYEKPCTLGELVAVGLKGGAIGLNLKWHNYFSLDSCYIHGARKYGIYAEGWSSRFRNSSIRWCFGAGIRATGHFNNCVVRDCYFSRNGIGFHFTGGYGNRIEGCAFEVCAKAALFLRGTNSFTVNNCYFEGNGYRETHGKHFQVEGSADTIHLDYSCTHINIHDSIFRCNHDPEGALISAAYVIRGHIYDNTFINSKTALLLRDGCETNVNVKPHFGQLIVERNFMSKVETPLAETRPGLIEQAITRGSAFRLSRRRTCDGSPVGKERPESIGDEILDLKARKWYKAVGPRPSDWTPMTE